ncbi:MAG: hypothetical protein M3300_10965 [Actinomycetota bacterium]|nr:hypothetical protein [Actinomycetota bacterium]
MFQARRSRRQALAAGAATAALFLAGPAALGGCTTSAPGSEGPDPLEGPARRAEADVALSAVVAGAHPTLAPAANALRVDRAAHAKALRAELHRVHPEPVPSSTTQPPPAVAPAVSPDAAAAQAALAQAMRAAQDEAAELVLTLPGYRAALLASIAACCATHTAVLT